MSEAIGPDSRLEMFPYIAGFSARLRRFNTPEIIVMLAVGKEDMPDILSLCDLIRDAAVIIMLSDEENDTVTSAIRLRPTFIGAMDGDLGKNRATTSPHFGHILTGVVGPSVIHVQAFVHFHSVPLVRFLS